MLLCGKDVYKGDIVQLHIIPTGGWLPVSNPVCKIDHTDKRKGIIEVSYRGISNICLGIDTVLGCKVVNSYGINRYTICNEEYALGDNILIDGNIYEVKGLTTRYQDGQICLLLDYNGREVAFPIESLSQEPVRKVSKDTFRNPLHPGMIGRDIILSSDGKAIGINFGTDIDKTWVSLEQGLSFVKRINDGKTINPLKKAFGSAEYVQLSPFIIKPATFRKFSIMISKADSMCCGLQPGEYTCFGFASRGGTGKLDTLIKQSDDLNVLLPLRGYKFLTAQKFMGCYNYNEDWFYVILDQNLGGPIMSIEHGLRRDNIAIVPKIYNKDGFCMIFMNRFSKAKHSKSTILDI